MRPRGRSWGMLPVACLLYQVSRSSCLHLHYFYGRHRKAGNWKSRTAIPLMPQRIGEKIWLCYKYVFLEEKGKLLLFRFHIICWEIGWWVYYGGKSLLDNKPLALQCKCMSVSGSYQWMVLTMQLSVISSYPQPSKGKCLKLWILISILWISWPFKWILYGFYH